MAESEVQMTMETPHCTEDLALSLSSERTSHIAMYRFFWSPSICRFSSRKSFLSPCSQIATSELGVSRTMPK